MIVHNLSDLKLTQEELQVLNKGLSFALTPITPHIQTHKQLLKDFDNYAKSVRQKYVHATYHQPTYTNQTLSEENTTTTTVHRRMKFLPPQVFHSSTQIYSGIGKVEHYIDTTKKHSKRPPPTYHSPNKK